MVVHRLSSVYLILKKAVYRKVCGFFRRYNKLKSHERMDKNHIMRSWLFSFIDFFYAYPTDAHIQNSWFIFSIRLPFLAYTNVSQSSI